MKAGTVVLILAGVGVAAWAGYEFLLKPTVTGTRQPGVTQATKTGGGSFFSSLGRTLGDFGQAANVAGSLQNDFSDLFS
jgi:hypothetical protein